MSTASPAAVAAPKRRLAPSVTRNLGLLIAFAAIFLIGYLTAGSRFASVDNMMTILRLAAIIGVVSIGQCFVITSGGIDLSVGSLLGLATVWATTGANQILVELFETRFDPDRYAQDGGSADAGAERTGAEEACTRVILGALDGVSSLDEDRILRSFLSVIQATLRTQASTRASG